MGRQVKSSQHCGGPAPLASVKHLAGGGNSIFNRLTARQPVVEKVRHHKQGVGGLQLGVIGLAGADKLEEGIDLHKLDAGLLKNFPA